MSTIAQQLQALAQIKDAIRQAINSKGVTVSSDAAFNTYATAIGQISGGGGDNSLLISILERTATNITIPASLITSVGSYAFANFSTLTSITLSEGITSIGENAFRGNSALTYIDIQSSVTSIAAAAFSTCLNVGTIICRRTSPPSVISSTFGNSNASYVGRNNYSGGTNKLYVPKGYTSAYTSATGGWATLLNSTRCGFSVTELDENGNIPT